jgi:SAM-dependent methyltransferase
MVENPSSEPLAAPMDPMQAVEWKHYFNTHHAHAGRSSERLREVEFEANFGRWLPAPPATVLEIGFGNGESLSRLSRRGYTDVHGWDVSADCIERARNLGLPGIFRHCDGVAALRDGPADRYDAILAKDLLEHLPREQVIPFISGLHRSLRPYGVFLARLPNMANPFSVGLRYDDFTHQLGFTENSIKQVFALGGFDRESVVVDADRLPAWPLLKAGLLGHCVREACLGPLVRWLTNQALATQRKGRPRVSTLRLIVTATKRATD